MTSQFDTIGLIEEKAIELDTGALALAAPDHQAIELQPYLDHFTQFTRRLAEAAGNSTSSRDRAKVLAGVLGGEFGYQGDVNNYEHPDNADLIKVIDRRRGLPVSLAILYVSAARRMGWQADPLNTPGHVLVRLGPETDPLIIDPFGKGAVVDSDGLVVFLRQVLGHEARARPVHVAPMGNRAVLVRLLLNQASRAEAAGDIARALILYERMTAIAPNYSHSWWDRARLESVTGDVYGASQPKRAARGYPRCLRAQPRARRAQGAAHIRHLSSWLRGIIESLRDIRRYHREIGVFSPRLCSR